MSDFEKLYFELVNSRGALTLTGWTTLKIRGGDRARFLHNMCTNDINGLKPGDGCEAFLTDVKGKIISHVTVLVLVDQLLLIAVPGQSDLIITHLEKYIIREDVELYDATLEGACSLLIGEESKEYLKNLLSVDEGSIKKPFQHVFSTVLSENCLVANAGMMGAGGFLLLVSDQSELPEIKVYEDHELWSAIRIESGYPLFDTDFDGSHLPQEVSRDKSAISFNKGCYLGQETVARIDALGHVNKLLRLIKFSSTKVPEVGTYLEREGKQVGIVSSSCWSPRLKAPLALAMLQRGSNELETKLESSVGSAVVLA